MTIEKKEKIVYPTLDFIDDLKEVLKNIVQPKFLINGRLSDQNFSLIIGEGKQYIESLKHKLRYKDPKWLIAQDKINSIKTSIENKIKNKDKILNKIFDNYQSLNDLPKYTGRIYKFHPNLKRDYFKEIDKKEKAYWLGWLFAEGWIESPRKNKDHLIGVGLSKKDENQLIRFIETIGFNKNYIRFKNGRKRVESYQEADYLEIGFQCYDFKSHLINNGFIVGSKKSKNIKLPKLSSYELYLAFLLGFFDGDGDQGTSLVNSGSKLFLKQIKQYFNLEFKIRFKESIGGYIENRFVKGSTYRMSLGTELFNQMLDNYENSMPRKRIYLQSKEEKRKRAIELSKSKKKLMFTKKDIESLIWELPIVKIAKKHEEIFGIRISNNTISKYIKKWNVNKPPPGFWNKKQKDKLVQ